MTDLQYLPALPPDKSPKIGCIGAGFIMADCHLPAYLQAGFQVEAIASRNQTNAEKVAARHTIAKTYASYYELLADESIEVVDIAVPPDIQLEVIREVVQHASHIRGVLAQKPLAANYADAVEVERLCREAGITLAVNQNMRYDHSVRACKSLLENGQLGEPVFATINMRAIPHWMPWQERQGWVTLRIMSIHHLDSFRYWFGDPERVFASVRPDPRTSQKFRHEDGIVCTILEYQNGLRACTWDDVWVGPDDEAVKEAVGINWRVEGETGLARGTIGWHSYPERTPSTIDYCTLETPGQWQRPRWNEVWFPDAFVGPMAQLLTALETSSEPEISGRDNLKTMALVEACYLSAAQHRAVAIEEITNAQ